MIEAQLQLITKPKFSEESGKYKTIVPSELVGRYRYAVRLAKGHDFSAYPKFKVRYRVSKKPPLRRPGWGLEVENIDVSLNMVGGVSVMTADGRVFTGRALVGDGEYLLKFWPGQ